MKATILAVNVAIFFSILCFSPLPVLLAKGLAIFVFIAVLWITEIFHVSVTSLLVPVLAVFLGVFDVRAALVEFSNPIIFLFFGGFALAGAMHKHQLDQLIATKLLGMAKGSLLPSSCLIFGLTALLSMWISNTATVAMMMPLVLGLLSCLDYKTHKATYLYFLLGTAYAGSIGGMGTIIGSPPNAIAADAIGLGFMAWMRFGIPMVLISLPLIVGLLYWYFRPHAEAQLLLERRDLRLTTSSSKVLAIFVCTLLGWMFAKPVFGAFGVTGNVDAIVAMLAVVALAGARVVSWKEISASTEWGVLILFGGGITLSAILTATGASLWMADVFLSLTHGTPLLLFILLSVAFVVFLTELASNTASAALLIPIFMSLAASIQLSPETMAIVIALSASCAFMLPVATPPNAIVFSTGYVPQKEMMRVGLWLNIVLIALISLLAVVFI